MTIKDGRLNLRKDMGKVSDVFTQSNVENLLGNVGIGQSATPLEVVVLLRRLCTSILLGSPSCTMAISPTQKMLRSMRKEHRHINTDSDSELLLNIFAESCGAE